MPLYILDTDHISLLQRMHSNVLQRLVQISRSELATTIITVEEQAQGRFGIIKRATIGPKLITAYADLQNTLAFFDALQVLPFDETANSYYEGLRQQRIRVGTYDLRIAAIALSVNGTIVTRNHKDFIKIPGLQLQNWTE